MKLYLSLEKANWIGNRFRKGRRSRDQIANIHWIIEKAKDSRKPYTSATLTMLKFLAVWITTNWKILKQMRIPDHLTCLLRNLYLVQEATVRTACSIWNNGLVQIWESSMSRLYIAILLNYMQNTSYEMLGWINHKMASRCYIQYFSKSGRPSSGHRTGKCQS